MPRFEAEWAGICIKSEQSGALTKVYAPNRSGDADADLLAG